ncbi:UDP-N-acetylmuramate dehydrogenase [Parapusillimonas granuli]|uniref:UDP-N-acetylenolpyruvoylglucosamine reductase n=1 Tax=Parapusillimonas granuli TaxID=380911 RepID=A0A853FXG9_9BURK|nr:UDP-N-acetylmuramate dehydrogenase [Parapusillimonas granuli]
MHRVGRFLQLIFDQDLSAFNTLGLSSRARRYVRYTDRGRLDEVSELAREHGPVFVLGGGSNVVLAPQVAGLVVKVATSGVRLLDQGDDHVLVEAEGGEVWHDFVARCVAAGWDGLENLALIPGTVGAAPVQNIGAYGVELDQRFHSLLAWDIARRRMVEMGPRDCGFAYRHSVFKEAGPGRWLIVAVRFILPRPWAPVLDYPDLRRHAELVRGAGLTARRVFDAVCEIRRSKLPDPAVLGNAGSFFKNPIVTAQALETLRLGHPDIVAYRQPDGVSYKLAAGWLIDRAGWKGRRMGPVGVHDRQALVLVNHGGASADDVLSLAAAIRSDVLERFGVALEQEPVNVA